MEDEFNRHSNPNDELLEDSEYSRKSEFSKAVITQGQVERCLVLRSKDMKPGYTSWVLDKSGNAHPQIIPDSRKEYVSAVEALKNLLSPEIDSKESGMVKKYDEKKAVIFEKYAYHERIRRTYSEKLDRFIWIYSKEVFLPQKGAELLAEDPSAINSTKCILTPKIWDPKIDAYWDSLVDIADTLFCDLNRLIHRLDYFKGGMSF